jgi:hypothetical protein
MGWMNAWTGVAPDLSTVLALVWWVQLQSRAEARGRGAPGCPDGVRRYGQRALPQYPSCEYEHVAREA